ncbi:MAG: CoA-binding protein [Deltaproteobacteria bacterium]|nr:CoA-binding protein [Candidatus Zymogenaceae bacterium]
MSTQDFWDAVFTPKTAAVVGKTGSMKGGYMFVSALRTFGFTGTLYVVSTDNEGGLGYDTYDRIDDLPNGIDYAILAVPAIQVPDAVRGLAAKGVRIVHVFSSGFSDLENAEGKKRTDALMTAARETGVRIIGPNCLGVFSPTSRLTYPPGVFPQEKGRIGFVSQSGGSAQSLAWSGKHHKMFVSKAVSLGNSVDLSVEDFLAYLIDDDETEIIALYLEGTANGRRLAELLSRASKKKPVVVLKVGLTEAGERAVSSHTGIMAGSGHLWEAALSQSGSVTVATFDELTETLSALDKLTGRPKTVPPGIRVALINRGGGEGVIAADVLPRMGIHVPSYTDKTVKRIADLIPDAGTGFKNPLDFSAVGGYPGIFEKMLDIIDEDEATDAIIYQHHIEFAHLFREGYNRYLMEAIADFNDRSRKALYVVLPLYYSGEEWLESFMYLTGRGVPVSPAIIPAAHVVANVSACLNRNRD